MKCKCRGCKERTQNCHSTCEAYKEFKEELEKIRKQEKYDEMLFNQTWSYTRTRKRRKR